MRLAGATPIGNGSDDRLLADFVDPANGCTAFSATNTTDAAGTSGSQALNELSARVNQTGTIAVVPLNDEMTLVNSAYSIAKTNVYRSLVDQPLLAANTDATTVAADYCQNMVNIAPAHNQLDSGQGSELRLPGPGHGHQPGGVHGGQAGRVVRGPGLRQVRPDRPGQRHRERSAASATAVTYNVAEQKAVIPAAAGGTATPTASPTTQPGSGLPWFGAPPRRSPAPPERNRHVATALDGPARSAVNTP